MRGGVGRIEWYRQAKSAGGRGTHGAPYRYTTGCRCEPCRDARNAYLRACKVERKAMAKAKFVIRKGSTGKFRFSLVGTNGKVIATSEAYESKAAAKKGVEAVRRLAAGAELDDRAIGIAPVKPAKKKATSKRVAPKAAGVTKSARLARQAQSVAASPDIGPVGVPPEVVDAARPRK